MKARTTSSLRLDIASSIPSFRRLAAQTTPSRIVGKPLARSFRCRLDRCLVLRPNSPSSIKIKSTNCSTVTSELLSRLRRPHSPGSGMGPATPRCSRRMARPSSAGETCMLRFPVSKTNLVASFIVAFSNMATRFRVRSESSIIEQRIWRDRREWRVISRGLGSDSKTLSEGDEVAFQEGWKCTSDISSSRKRLTWLPVVELKRNIERDFFDHWPYRSYGRARVPAHDNQ